MAQVTDFATPSNISIQIGCEINEIWEVCVVHFRVHTLYHAAHSSTSLPILPYKPPFKYLKVEIVITSHDCGHARPSPKTRSISKEAKDV
jgi:hypothetical protein